MRKLLSLLVILGITFISCDGRKTSNQALSESVEEFKKNVSLEVDTYIPDTFTERLVDTVLSNGYNVKIRTYTDMENSVLYTKIKDTINYQTHYRNFKFEIIVMKEEKVIYNKRFDKVRANELLGFTANYAQNAPFYNFDKTAILKSIEVNSNSSLTNRVAIDILYEIPESDKFGIHTLFIDEQGKSNVALVEEK